MVLLKTYSMKKKLRTLTKFFSVSGVVQCKFKEVKQFLNQISSTTGDSFLHNGTIYKKKITSGTARKLLDGFMSNRCYDIHELRKAANQLKIRL